MMRYDATTFGAMCRKMQDANLFRGQLAALKSEYELAAKEPSDLRYGYVRVA